MNSRPRGLAAHIACLLVVLFVGGCTPFATGSQSTAGLCDGISAEMGGCSSSRPVFSGKSCDEVAREWGTSIDQEVVKVMNGPAVIDDKQRSVRISDAVVVASVVAGMRLDALGLLPACDAPAFLAAGQPQFSDALLAGIPNHLYDGNPVAPMADWEAMLTRVLGILDEGE